MGKDRRDKEEKTDKFPSSFPKVDLEWVSFGWVMYGKDMQGQAPLLSILP